jgi:esterase/lipase superfamily enzyme
LARWQLTLGLVVLAACSSRGTFTAAPDGAIAGAPEAIFVGTTRRADSGDFGKDRADQASFLRYDIAIPPDREPGTVNWPPKSRAPDPARDFLTLAESRFDGPTEFRKALGLALRQEGQTSAVVYVHGFNTTLAEGVYRVAQMHHDLQVPGVAVHYAWPSRGSALAYVYDRESALFGRSGLESLLTETTAAGTREVVIVAHSMGAALTMETLRQMVLRDGPKALDRVAGVVLISPDLDVDVFRSLALEIGELPQPFVIFGSSRDRILGLSARVSGSGERLGNLKDLSRIADQKVVYLDTAAYDFGSGHLNLGTNPALLSLFAGILDIDAAFRADAKSRVGLLPGIVLTVRNATEIVLAPVGALGEAGLGD